MLQDHASANAESEKDDDEEEFDEYGNRMDAKTGAEGDSAEESVAKREFDLTTQIGESLATVPENLQPLLLSDGQLAAKSKNWRAMSRKRYNERRKHGYVESQKEMLPPEVLR